MTVIQLGTKANGRAYTVWFNRRTRRLDLRDQNLITVDLTTLAEAPNLESFRIDRNPLRTLDLTPLADYEQLRELGVTAEGSLDLTQLPALPALHTLHIDCQQWSMFNIASVARLSHLKALYIYRGTFDTLDLVPLVDCTALEHVSIIEHQLVKLDVTPLVELIALHTLTLKPLPQLFLDDVYAHHPQRIVSPAVRDLVRQNRCIATGSMARINTLLHRLPQPPHNRTGSEANMDEAGFWQLIEEAHTDPTDVSVEIARRLWSLSPTALKQFRDLYWHFMGIPGEEIHDIIYEVRGGCSDDDFLDFRDWLIAQGYETYRQVVETPEVLVEWGEGWLDFREGVVFGPLYQVCEARGV